MTEEKFNIHIKMYIRHKPNRIIKSKNIALLSYMCDCVRMCVEMKPPRIPMQMNTSRFQ